MANIIVLGLGYVGLSNALVLARNNSVIGYDTDEQKIRCLQNKLSPLTDLELSKELVITTCKFECNKYQRPDYKWADYIFIALPTNYDETRKSFDMTLITGIIENILKITRKPKIIIKSTVSIGYTESVISKFNYRDIIFMPEFLREGKAFTDCLSPSRIIFGTVLSDFIGDDIIDCCNETDIFYMQPTEAEAVKLFANTYLAMRVAYFNELDMYADSLNLNSASIIRGVCSDPRIGNYYNNPSFGYGGYCLPKDTKQLLANYTNNNIDQRLISAIIESNTCRKQYIIDQVLSKKPKVVGIYKLAMKASSDNYRQAAILDIILGLQNAGIKCIIYDSSLTDDILFDCPICKSFLQFCEISDIILANRKDLLPDDLKNVITYDRFGGDQ